LRCSPPANNDGGSRRSEVTETRSVSPSGLRRIIAVGLDLHGEADGFHGAFRQSRRAGLEYWQLFAFEVPPGRNRAKAGEGLLADGEQALLPYVVREINACFLFASGRSRPARRDELLAPAPQHDTKEADDGNPSRTASLRPLRSSMSRRSAWSSLANSIASASPISTIWAYCLAWFWFATAAIRNQAGVVNAALQFVPHGLGDDHFTEKLGKKVGRADGEERGKGVKCPKRRSSLNHRFDGPESSASSSAPNEWGMRCRPSSRRNSVCDNPATSRRLPQSGPLPPRTGRWPDATPWTPA